MSEKLMELFIAFVILLSRKSDACWEGLTTVR